MSVNHSTAMLRYQVESEENWKEWLDKVPSIRFDEDWDVKVIPPYEKILPRRS